MLFLVDGRWYAYVTCVCFRSASRYGEIPTFSEIMRNTKQCLCCVRGSSRGIGCEACMTTTHLKAVCLDLSRTLAKQFKVVSR